MFKMLKHCSTLSLDTSRRSLRQDNRVSLYSPPPWEEGEAREGMYQGVCFTREVPYQGLSLTTLPRPKERPCVSLPRYVCREDTVKECSDPKISCCDSVPSNNCDHATVATAYSDSGQTASYDSEKSYSTSISEKTLLHGEVLSSQTSVRAIKVYATCLRPHLSYKTVVITPHTTSKQVILGLLSRFRMRHRDPNLFHLTMEVTVELGARQTILLEDNSRPAEMISCNPWAGCKFILQAKQGGLVRVYDHLVRPESVYKCLIISEETTVGDTIGILRSCYREEEEWGLVDLQLWEVGEEQERQLGEQEQPLVVMAGWGEESKRFLLRREGLERGLGYRNSLLRQTIRRHRRSAGPPRGAGGSGGAEAAGGTGGAGGADRQ